MKHFVLVAVVTGFSFLLVACDLPHESRPSVLVIAVEGLGFDKLSCDTDESPARPEPSAFQALCQESVRFSHAYAPSTMSQTTMASLLTGLYPFDHGVRHNGSDFLSAKMKSVAEGALGRGYRTLLVSGGPPIWRKSGLSQGFEVFEDNVDIAPGSYYRPAQEVVRLSTNWLEAEALGRPFFNVLYLADLQFPQVATKSKEGELREKSSSAQLEEINESLGDLFQWLRAKRRWNSTNIVLVGLNSLENRESDDVSPLNLKSASVQVTLMIKPARKERDNMIQWGIDRNVSLVDVGYTLFQLLGIEPPTTSLSLVKPESLLSVLTQSEPSWKEDRLILTETAWPDWIEGDGIRWAVRQNQFLYIHDKKPLIFNTLTDRLENYSLRETDPLWISLSSGIYELLSSAQTPVFNGMQAHWLEMLRMGRSLWSVTATAVPAQGREPWTKWVLAKELKERNWKEVRRLAHEMGDPVGAFVAARQMGEAAPMPRNPCVRLFLSTRGDKRNFQSECEDEKLLALHAWQSAKTDEERILAQDRFLRMYSQYWLDQEIGRVNFLNNLKWDVDRRLPEAPATIEYLLTLKEFEPYAKRLATSLMGKDLRL